MFRKSFLLSNYRKYLNKKYIFQKKMSSENSSFNLHEMINVVNKSLPPEDRITLTKIIRSCGSSQKVTDLIHEKLNLLLNCKCYKEHLKGPIFQITPVNFWECRYVLEKPQNISFISTGSTQIDSEYFSKITILLWLDKDIFSKQKCRKEKLGAEQVNKDVQPVNSDRTGTVNNSRKELANGNNGVKKLKVNTVFLQKVLKDVVTQNELHNLHARCLIENNRFLHNATSSTNLKDNTDEINLKDTDIKNNLNSEEIVLKTAKIEQVTAVSSLPSATSTKLIKQVYFNEDEQTGELLKLFPSPKNVLHNVYDQLSRKTKKNSFKVVPQYKLMKDPDKSMWVCTYRLCWPEEIKFSAKDSKKSKASHKAALAALSWLRSNKKITKTGLPVIYEKAEVTKLSQKTVPVLVLKESAIQNMKKIVNIHRSQIVPHIIKSKLETDESDSIEGDISSIIEEPDDVNLKQVKTQRYIGLKQYLAKEQVELPITPHKDDFIKLLKTNQIIVLKGEPGCGKSTRIPQYVLEAWAKEDGLLGDPCRIAVTQPRRIAAISLAERVSIERSEAVGNIVGYQVRLKSNFRPQTGRILYCTTGILLRYLQSDSKLSTFTHIILDEAHERDVNTDLLMNLLRSAIKTNPNLKLIVMSATIDTDMFREYFGGVPVMEIPGFTYPVKQHFLDSCKNIDVSKTIKMCESEVPSVVHDDVVNVIRHLHKKKKEGAILCFLPGWEDISKVQKNIPTTGDIVVYCLHSRLQDSEQWKIFSKPPPGVRKVILATNIAETSVTIDDVVYVIDTGIQKEQRFDVDKGIHCLDNHWISKANVRQRGGRAGRVQPGESFHLYTRSKFESFPEYALPEILRISLTKIVLDSKVFSNNMNAIEFMRKLPTPPEENAVSKAVAELTDLELLDDEENLTSLGKTVANFQLEPKLSKAMVNSVIFKCVTPIVDIVTLFSTETEFFMSGLLDKTSVKNVKEKFCKNSDHLAMMRLFEKWLEYAQEGDNYALRRFCNDANLSGYKMETIEKLRKIHFDYLYDGLYDVLPISDDFSDNDELVKAVLFSGVGTVLKHRTWDIAKSRLKNNVNVFLTRNNHKATITTESVNFKRHKFPTNFLLYINETRSNIRRASLIRECSLIPEIAVLLFSNRNLDISDVDKDDFSTNIKSDDQVKLSIQNTNIELLCDRAEAQDFVECKDAIMAGYRYYVHQLTDKGEPNPEVNSAWDNILALISDILDKHSI